MSTYKLAICVIFNDKLFGKDENSSPDIDNHHLIMWTFKPTEFYDKHQFQNTFNSIKAEILHLYRRSNTHPIIRNYAAIIQNENNIKLDIIKCDELSGLEQVGYIKTFWLKIIQRRWKNVYKERQLLLTARSNPRVLQERQKTGQWPKHLRDWPKFTLNLHDHRV